jgi:uncharacterized protein (DUF302 family)
VFWAKHSAGLPFVAFESEQDPIGLDPTIDGIAAKPVARLALPYSHYVTPFRIVAALTAAISLWGVQAMAADGLTTIKSSHGPEETMESLEAAVKAKGLTVFARIDHAAGAAEVGLSLRPTELLIFGNAKGGTPLMQSNQTVGIDLPLKALVWQDASGDTWLSYDDPSWIAKRHGLGPEVDAPVKAMSAVLDAIARTATISP